MKRKRRIISGEIYKWKARLNVHGGKQEHGIHYWETYSPVVKWFSIRLFLTLALINNWHSRQVDFVLAYPQADIKTKLYMEIPQGFDYNGKRKTHVLRLLKNIYGQKQAGRVWNQFLHQGLTELGFVQSKIDECVYYRGSTIFLCYVDDAVLLSPDSNEIDSFFNEMKGLGYDITDEGEIDNYLGVKVERRADGTIKLSQPHLIQQILDDLNLRSESNDNASPKRSQSKSVSTPAASTVLLNRDKEGKPHNESWSYRSVIGKLNFLEKSTRPEIAYSVHQCARFSTNPKGSHSSAVKRIGRYLLGTKDDGIILKPDSSKSFDCYLDSDFCGLWDAETALYDPATAKSRTGFLIQYAGCPILWKSKLQTNTALSTTEAEYNAASEALCHVLPLMELLQEAHGHVNSIPAPKTKLHCQLFIDNKGTCELVRLPKLRPRTKHINTRLHHFREHTLNKQGAISVHHVPTEDNLSDIFTKPLNEQLFCSFRDQITLVGSFGGKSKIPQLKQNVKSTVT